MSRKSKKKSKKQFKKCKSDDKVENDREIFIRTERAYKSDDSFSICSDTSSSFDPVRRSVIPTISVSSADETVTPGDDDSVFDFHCPPNIVDQVSRLSVDLGTKPLFSPPARYAEKCNSFDLFDLTNKFVQTPRSARTSVSSVCSLYDSDSQDENIDSDDSGEKTPHVNPYTMACLFSDHFSRERAKSRETFFDDASSDNSPNMLTPIVNDGSSTLTRNNVDRFLFACDANDKTQSISSYLGVDGAHAQFGQNNNMRSSVSSPDLTTICDGHFDSNIPPELPEKQRSIPSTPQTIYFSDDDSGSDYYDTIDSDLEDDDTFHNAQTSQVTMRKPALPARRPPLQRQESEDVSSEYENIYDSLDNYRRQSSGSREPTIPTAPSRTSTIPPPLPPRPPTLIFQSSTEDCVYTNDNAQHRNRESRISHNPPPLPARPPTILFHHSADSNNHNSNTITEGDEPPAQDTTSYQPHDPLTYKWKRKRVVRSCRRKTPSSEDDKDTLISTDARECDTNNTKDDADHSIMSESSIQSSFDESGEIDPKSTPSPFDLDFPTPLLKILSQSSSIPRVTETDETDSVGNVEIKTSQCSHVSVLFGFENISNPVNLETLVAGCDCLEIEDTYGTSTNDRDGCILTAQCVSEKENGFNSESDDTYIAMDTTISAADDKIEYNEQDDYMTMAEMCHDAFKTAADDKIEYSEQNDYMTMTEMCHDTFKTELKFQVTSL